MNEGILESDIERIGRVISGRYNLQVVFEKDRLYTDGRKIYLPRVENMSPALKDNIFVLLDHQLAHIYHSDFAALRSGSSKFHNDLLMAAEDARVEALMMEDMPGTRYGFKSLNDQLRSVLRSNWNQLSGQARAVAMTRDILMNRPLVNDRSVRAPLARHAAFFDRLRQCGSTEEIKAVTGEMARAWASLANLPFAALPDPSADQVDLSGNIHPEVAADEVDVEDMPLTDEAGPGKREAGKNEKAEKEKPPKEGEKDKRQDDQDGESQDDSEEPGEGEPSEDGKEQEQGGQDEGEQPGAGEGEEEQKEDAPDQEGQGKGGPGEEENDEQEQDGQGAGGSAEDKDGEDPEEPSEEQSAGEASGNPPGPASEKDAEPAEEVVGQGEASEDDEMDAPDESATDIESMVNSQIKRASRRDDSGIRVPDAPVTTAYDKITEHGRKFARGDYARIKSRVSHVLLPVQESLERAFKVQENARWVMDRERGRLVSKNLSKLVASPGYRTPFGQYQRTETKNVAVEILVDLSGSMSGGKIVLARDACVAMAEALSALDIPFEITGFTTAGEPRMPSSTQSSHLRWTERMDYHVFKSFDDTNLAGISAMATGQQNPDGEAVLWAARRINERNEARRVLLVLSDGQPAASDQPTHVLEEHLKRVLEAVSAQNIETVGIGIATDAPAEFYPDCVIINDIDELPRVCLDKLSEILLRPPGSASIPSRRALGR